MANSNSDENEETNQKTLFGKILGKNAEDIPCFRTSFMTGILGGLGSGAAYFVFTSNSRRAPHVAFGSYGIITLGAWFMCRFEYYKKIKEEWHVKRAMQHSRIPYEVVDCDNKILSQADDTEA